MKIRWQNWAGDTIENLFLRKTLQSIIVKSTITCRNLEPFTAKYRMILDPLWRVRNLTLEITETKEILALESDGCGCWSDSSGSIQKLDGVIDPDITATPFTNTIPIRRLRLKEKQAEEIVVVYISIPEMKVSLDLQRYTCLVPGKLYRFEQIESGFVREIKVDKNGFVITYPGFFKRL